MWKEVHIDAPNVIGLECSGKVSETEFERMHDWLDEKLRSDSKPALIVFMGNWEGYEDASALWEDMKIETRHRDDFSRVAIVGDQDWIEWGVKAGNLLTGAELKWFDTKDRANAISWVSGSS